MPVFAGLPAHPTGTGLTAYVALLRAINVGGKTTLAMADLRDLAASLGLSEPRTLLRTGNLIFGSDEGAAACETRITGALSARCGLATDVLVRSAEEWRAIIDANPFPDAARDDPAHLVVMPLRDGPRAGAQAALRAAIKGPERIAVVGRTVYLAYPDGIGRSKLTLGLVERHLGTRGTGRNWTSAMKIATSLLEPS